MANITEIKGNIFESNCQTIVNTVNCVGFMGKGIAFEFKNRFPEMYQRYKEMCDKDMLKPGLLYLYKKSKPWILNFPTKDDWKYPSKIEYIELGLKKFVNTYKKIGITSIAFPELGSSLGGLNWNDVKTLMYKYLSPIDNLDIEIYHFDPQAKDSLFDKLYQIICRFEIEDYKIYLGLKPKQSKLLKEFIQNKSISSMLDLQKINGIGEKSFEKIYKFVQSDTEIKRITTINEKQQSLF